jgi:hypothetical protein
MIITILLLPLGHISNRFLPTYFLACSRGNFTLEGGQRCISAGMAKAERNRCLTFSPFLASLVSHQMYQEGTTIVFIEKEGDIHLVIFIATT